VAWFYLHCVIAVVILIADAKGTLEPTIKNWEKKLGIPVPEEIVKEDVQNTTPSEYNSTHFEQE
jgi:hypothetical protein